jgi:hypothetical protein
MTTVLFGIHKHDLDQAGTQNNCSEDPLSIHPFSMREPPENSRVDETLEKVNKQRSIMTHQPKQYVSLIGTELTQPGENATEVTQSVWPSNGPETNLPISYRRDNVQIFLFLE